MSLSPYRGNKIMPACSPVQRKNLPYRSSQCHDISVNLLTTILYLAHECSFCGTSVTFVVIFTLVSVLMATPQLIISQLRAGKVCGLILLSRKGQVSSYLPLALCASQVLECWKALLLAHDGKAYPMTLATTMGQGVAS